MIRKDKNILSAIHSPSLIHIELFYADRKAIIPIIHCMSETIFLTEEILFLTIGIIPSVPKVPVPEHDRIIREVCVQALHFLEPGIFP